MRCALALAAVPTIAANTLAAEAELRLRQIDGNVIPGAVFYAIPAGNPPLSPPAPAVMDQRGKTFSPFILVAQQGAAVKFTNSDAISHHVYSFSPAKRFDFYLSQGASRSVTFERPGVVALGCNIHDWMLAYVLVVETPHFARTDGDGRARLAGLPAGRYELRVWHPRMADLPSPRVVDLTATAHEEWSLTLAKTLLAPRTGEPNGSSY